MIEKTGSDIYVFLGGTRSGKSVAAEQKVHELAKGGVLYVATAQVFGNDVTMQQRILRHKQRRPSTWQVLECPTHLYAAVRAHLITFQENSHHANSEKSCILIDCVTLWMSNILFAMTQADSPNETQAALENFEDEVRREITELLALTEEFAAHWVFVSGEIGLGGIGMTAMERMFHDGLGLANQLLVAQAKEAYLAVAGRLLKL